MNLNEIILQYFILHYDTDSSIINLLLYILRSVQLFIILYLFYKIIYYFKTVYKSQDNLVDRISPNAETSLRRHRWSGFQCDSLKLIFRVIRISSNNFIKICAKRPSPKEESIAEHPFLHRKKLGGGRKFPCRKTNTLAQNTPQALRAFRGSFCLCVFKFIATSYSNTTRIVFI